VKGRRWGGLSKKEDLLLKATKRKKYKKFAKCKKRWSGWKKRKVVLFRDQNVQGGGKRSETSKKRDYRNSSKSTEKKVKEGGLLLEKPGTEIETDLTEREKPKTSVCAKGKSLEREEKKR